MTNEQKQLLIRALELTELVAASEPEPWHYEHDEWLTQMEHGPRYLASRWHGPLDERMRMRYRRAIDVLESLGLVKTHRAWQTRLTHFGLTEAGRIEAVRLRDEKTKDTEAAADG
jgi:hypothetical protein